MHWSIIFHFSAIKWLWLIKRLVHWRCSYKPFLTYFNKVHGEAYKKKNSKQLIQKTKIDYLNDKNVVLKNNEKK